MGNAPWDVLFITLAAIAFVAIIGGAAEIANRQGSRRDRRDLP